MSMERQEIHSAEMQQRLRQVLNSDRAALSPKELQELQRRIALALGDLMILEKEGIEFRIERDRGKRILTLRLPVQRFLRSDSGSEEVNDADISFRP